jgi:BirA family biotin operon repressor/biotin-[acetyl-CoA-carboxylase] ligase
MSPSDFATFKSSRSAEKALDLDRLQESLGTQRLSGRVHYFAETDSTNARARQLAENSAAEGEIVIAESQTQGRGRLGRRWESPPFANLYFSVLLRPRLAPSHAPQITLMAAVALAEAVDSFIPQTPTIKWPNDILVDGKKLAGILTEAACSAERVDYVILGLGVNVNYSIDAMPEPIRERATSILELTQQNVSRESLLRRLIQGLDRCYGELERSGFDALAQRWQAYFGWRGRRVQVGLLGQVSSGCAKGIDRDGALLIVDDDGVEQRVVAGDVTLLES